ncbi:MAG: hypothetical protein K6T63_05355 [Alicyclobacillus herbarius]|uniref:hypothetical protein n=1 Tax=Alicyclobacillus herbarius TaxID=122960 RepID=UPI0003FD42FD|nr:hypothetical protein [Alicyclobacillus herbarius]MCL6632043.1 hypothetical protein [Alicyclobacillus herbarius]
MPAFVQIGQLNIGGASNCVGVFSGQNMQNNWDANSPTVNAMGTMSGNASQKIALVAFVEDRWWLGQPVIDTDIKNNASPMITG